MRIHNGPQSVANVNHLQVRIGPSFAIRFMEDNQATITILSKGDSAQMRHTDRTQRISFGWLKEQFDSSQFDLINVNTLFQAADILTKPLTSPTKWQAATTMLNMTQYTPPKQKSAVAPSRGESEPEQIEENSVLLPSLRKQHDYDRILVEWCCSEDSKLCQKRKQTKGCHMIRVTESESDDATTDACVTSIAKQVQQLCSANPLAKVLAHASLPCTGGCPWNNINKNNQGGQSKIEEHQKKFKVLLKKLDKILDTIKDVFPYLSFELPTFCEYWKWTTVRSFVDKHDLIKHQLHGCQVGVTKQNGEPLKKGWTIASNVRSFSVLDKLCCQGEHNHAQSRGKALKAAEGYTYKLTDKIHSCFRRLALSHVRACLAAEVPCIDCQDFSTKSSK